MTQYDVIPGRLALARENAGLTQTQFANKISELLDDKKSISNSIVSMWETGRRKMPYFYMDIVTGILKVTPAYLLGLTDDEKSHKNDVASGETDKIEIPLAHLSKYDGQPIFVVFTSYTHENAWGIYDRNKDQIVFKDYIYKLKRYREAVNTSNPIKIYTIPPSYATSFNMKTKKALDMIKMRSYDMVYVEMKSPDRGVRNLYNGWYHHNETKTALVNNIGLVLPYEGLNISYSAFSMGDADPNKPLEQ